MKPETLKLFQAASRNAMRAPGNRVADPAWLKLNKAGKDATIYVYGDITPVAWWEGDVSANAVLNQLQEIDAETIHVRINSAGGSVFDGVAIYNLLRDHAARIITHVDSLAASIASVIAMAGDEIVISEGAQMMVHPASTVVWGNAEQLRHEATILESIEESIVAVYARRTGKSEDAIKAFMNAANGEGTWFTGAKAVANGFADRLAEKSDPKPENFSNVVAMPGSPLLNSPEQPKGAEDKRSPLSLIKRRVAAIKLNTTNK